jgi:hypothetical protein
VTTSPPPTRTATARVSALNTLSCRRTRRAIMTGTTTRGWSNPRCAVDPAGPRALVGARRHRTTLADRRARPSPTLRRPLSPVGNTKSWW